VPVLAVYLCPSSVCVLATFSGTVLFPLLLGVQLKSGPLTKPWIFHIRCYL